MSIIIDPEAIYEPFNDLSLDQLRVEVGKMLKNGITVRCNDGKDDIIIRSDYLAKSGAFKDIYLLDLLSISNNVYNSRDYILKIRFTANTPEYWNNEKSILPNQGVIPIVMSEGKRYEMIDGEIKKYFAEILPTKSHILLNTQNFIVDFIIQERMDMSLDFIRKHYQLPIEIINYVMYNLLDIAKNISNKGYTFTNFSPTSVMLKFVVDHVEFKLVNTSFIQRDDMVRIDGHRKLYSTASIAQLTSTPEDPRLTMFINILYTCFDLYQPYSLADRINSTCCKDSSDLSCLIQHLISARNKQILLYAENDKVLVDIINAMKSNTDIKSIYNNVMSSISIDPEIEKQFTNIIYNVITSTVTFEQPALNYWNSDAFVYDCTVDSDNQDSVFGNLFNTGSTTSSAPVKSSYSVGNLFNTASEEDEPISLKPILSGSNTASRKSAPVKSSYSVGNLFNTGSTTSSAPVKSSYSVGNLFNTASEEDEPISLKPILSGSSITSTNDKPVSTDSMFDYLNKRIDNLQEDVNQKFDDILDRLD